MNNLESYNQFKEKPLEERQTKSSKYIQDNPGRVPVVLINNNDKLQLSRIKFLIPKRYKILSLIKTIKKSATMSSEETLYLSVGKNIQRNTVFIGELFERYRNEDGFLYLNISNVPAFGNTK